MLNARPPYKKRWLIPGGIGFGLYFTLGFMYFETFHWGSANLLHYLPVFLIFGVQCSLLALLLFGKARAPEPGNRFSPRLVIWPLVTFAGAGLLAWIYAGLAGPHGFSLPYMGQLFRDLLLTGLLPVAAVLVLLQGKKPAEPSVPVEEPEVSPAPEMLILPQGASGTVFELALEQLVLAETADNYCKLFYLTDGALKMEMLRISLKEVEQAVEERGQFFRCHRSFLINGKQVQKITGNSQAYKLKVAHYPEPVPVSRSFDLAPLRSLIS